MKKLLLAITACLLIFALLGAGVPAPDPEGIAIPILMYHSILKDSSAWNAYVLSPDQLAQDMAWLQAHGYQAVTMQALIDYVYLGTPLPEKPVVLSFDDGYLNNLTYLPNLLETYDMQAVISVVGQYMDAAEVDPYPSPSYSYLTRTEIQALDQNPRIEIQNHSYSFHTQAGRRGASRNAGESLEAYTAVLAADFAKMDALLADCGVQATTFTYPFGHCSDCSDGIVKSLGYKATLSCTETISTIYYGDPDSLFSLGRFNRPSGISTADFMAHMGLS